MATIEADCEGGLEGLAARVAERLLVDRGIDRAPAPRDYRIARCVDDEGKCLEVALDLGRGIVIPVYSRWQSGEEHYPWIERFSALLGILYEDSPNLLPIPHMAKLRIKKLAAAGVPCRLASVAPARLDADHRWTAHIFMDIEAIDASLRVSRKSYSASHRKEFACFLKEFERKQNERMFARASLSRYGATAAVEVVLLNALRGAGVDDKSLLRQLNQSLDVQTEVVAPDGTRFELRWSSGCVMGSVTLDPGVTWCAGQLDFEQAPRRFDARNIGRPLDEIYSHRLLAAPITVRGAWGQKGHRARLTCSVFTQPLHLQEEKFIDVV